MIPDPLLLDTATDDGDVNVIGGTFPCESIYNFECKFFGFHEKPIFPRSVFLLVGRMAVKWNPLESKRAPLPVL